MSRLLATRELTKVWGRDRLPAPFAGRSEERIGEIWFEPAGELPDLLVKYLFTSEKLSVQVHPGDHDMPEGTPGKEECWLILDAEPGARLAIGLDREVGADELARAARDGSIEDMLTWHDAGPGDFFYLPAGTIHAIGPGITLAEIQQNNDITYRLYDYGRSRELHLDAALRVAKREPYDTSRHATRVTGGPTRLVAGPHFRVDYIEGGAGENAWARQGAGERHALLLPLDGAYAAGGITVAPGQCALVDAGETIAATRDGSRALLAFAA